MEVPKAERSRQAVSALRGYAFQLYQSVLAWITLGPKEELHLEVAEDYAVIAEDALVATQVKDTPTTPATLNSQSVRKAIQSFWNLQEANPDREVRFRFLTTAPIGKERSGTFPGDVEGLRFWRIAARNAGNAQPIRAMLANSGFSSELQSFIKNASDDELRKRLLRPISWDCESGDILEVKGEILDELVTLGGRMWGLTPSEAESAHDVLIARVLDTVINPRDRRLRYCDFLREFAPVSMVSIPKSQVRGVMETQRAKLGVPDDVCLELDQGREWSAELPLPPRLVERSELATDLRDQLGRTGVLWLYGSSGVGKSTLARLVARLDSGKWLCVALRGLDSEKLSYRLRSLGSSEEFKQATGVILDDLAIGIASNALQRLRTLALALRRGDKSLIVTSSGRPTSVFRDAVGPCHETASPYLTVGEVEQMVRDAGGAGEAWGKSVHVFCSGGHPQLVAARIGGLTARGWPREELLPIHSAHGLRVVEVEEERTRVRMSLVEALPVSHRTLLYRLAVVMSYFDRPLALALADAPEKLPNPGEILDSLVGPWIEVIGHDRLRVSPLVADSGWKGLSEDTQKALRRRIVDQLLLRKPFPVEFLGELFWQALASEHLRGLYWIVGAVLFAKNHEQRIAEALIFLPFCRLDASGPLVPSNPHVSFMLRLAQLRVAIRLDPGDSRIELIVDRALEESRFASEVGAGLATFLTLNMILVERSVALRPSKWISLLEKLTHVVESRAVKEHLPETRRLISPSWGSRSGIQMLFFARAQSLRGVTELSELLRTLDELPREPRQLFLSALREPEAGAALVVNSAWLAEERRGVLEPDQSLRFAAEFLELSYLPERWGAADIAVELLCSQAVMLDEFANRPNEALEAVQSARERFPNDLRLDRREFMIHYRQAEYRAALDPIRSLEEHLAGMGDIDGAFFARRVAVCRVEAGDLSAASNAFELGHARASGSGVESLVPMSVGLLADRAVVEFERGNPSLSLDLLAKALHLAQAMPVERGLSERWCWLSLSHTIRWLWYRAEGRYWGGEPVAMRHGLCSDPDRHEECAGWKVNSPLACWYILATAEQISNAGDLALRELRSRTRNTLLPGPEVILLRHILLSAIQRLDIQSFRDVIFDCLTASARWVGGSVGEASSVSEREWTRDEFEKLPPSSAHMDAVAIDACAALLACAAANGNNPAISDVAELILSEPWASEATRECLRVVVERHSQPLTWEQSLFRSIQVLTDVESLGPTELYWATVKAWQWLPLSGFRSAVELGMVHCLLEKWGRMVKEQPFALYSPNQTVLRIEASLRSSKVGLSLLAGILLAAEDAVRPNLPGPLRESIMTSAAQAD